jgi:hypothetical protein
MELMQPETDERDAVLRSAFFLCPETKGAKHEQMHQRIETQ